MITALIAVSSIEVRSVIPRSRDQEGVTVFSGDGVPKFEDSV